jgi:hypothetical protein
MTKGWPAGQDLLTHSNGLFSGGNSIRGISVRCEPSVSHQTVILSWQRKSLLHKDNIPFRESN